MNFIIQETGEKKTVLCIDKNGCDWSEEVAGSCGFDSGMFTYNDEEDAYVAPKCVVDDWVWFFETYNTCEGQLYNLRHKYDSSEIEEIMADKMPDFDIYVYKEAVKNTAAILQKRYDTKTARLVHSYYSNLPQSDFRYYQEHLYQQDDGSYFLTGEGGPMSGYQSENEDGSLGYGEASYSITAAQAQKWLMKYRDDIEQDE